MITIQALTLQRGNKIIFSDASVSIFAKQKLGIVGINGSGKSTLFALLLKQLQPDAGNVFTQANLRIGYLSQEVPQCNIPAIEYVMQGDTELYAMFEQLKHAENKNNHLAITELHNKLHLIDGYAAESRAGKLLYGLGFANDEQRKPVNAFSGGWRMRLNLAQVLMRQTDLLLLDEPTNYLDFDAIVWLERWLQNYAGTLLLISHDREFLDNVVNKIIHINNLKLDLYYGNYSAFEELRNAKLLLEQQQYNKQQAYIEHLTKFVDRFRYKASKAKQAQSRLKMLEKMERVSLSHITSPFSFAFLEPQICKSQLLKLENVSFSYADKPIFQNVNFSLNSGDRIGILGSNGAGKSTFMKLLAGLMHPQSGNYLANKFLKIGYFAQHQVEQLNCEQSALQHLQQLAPQTSEQKIRTFLGSFNFKNEMIFNPVSTFSGGEKARLVLAILVWQAPNLLLLDEPTNHLDLDMREALAYALQEYAGAMVLVSHDRYLLKATVNEFYLMHEKKLVNFSGDLTDYQNWLLETKKQTFTKETEIKHLTTTTNTNNKPNPKKIRQLEEKLAKLYIEKENYEQKLAEPAIYAPENKEALQETTRKFEQIKRDIQSSEKLWLELSDVV